MWVHAWASSRPGGCYRICQGLISPTAWYAWLYYNGRIIFGGGILEERLRLMLRFVKEWTVSPCSYQADPQLHDHVPGSTSTNYRVPGCESDLNRNHYFHITIPIQVCNLLAQIHLSVWGSLSERTNFCKRCLDAISWTLESNRLRKYSFRMVSNLLRFSE
jgi:hypothetical protein